jgi:orotate phosphoribosyltransferase
MNFKSVADLNRDVREWMTSLPRDIDLVIGVPRSGMLVANLLALDFNLPLADLDGFLKGHIMAAGARQLQAWFEGGVIIAPDRGPT